MSCFTTPGPHVITDVFLEKYSQICTEMKLIRESEVLHNLLNHPQTSSLQVPLTKEIPNASHCSHLIRSFLSQGAPREALLFYSQIRRKGVHHHTIIPVLLKACGLLSFLQHGRALHAECVKIGVNHDVIIGTSLVSMYSKCEGVTNSLKMFDEMPEKNVITWNAMIGGYSRDGDMHSALSLFQQMQKRTPVTWVEMIDGFARNGDIVSARRLFDQAPVEMRNVVTWTVMVDGYVSNALMEAARQLFEQMPRRNFYAWSSMIAGYCKNGDVKEAKAIFDRIPVRNLVNWNSLIAGYAQNGFGKEALEAFEKMQAEGFQPDEVTVTSALSACATMGSLDSGKQIHNLIKHRGIKLNQFVLNSLIDMYAKCGELENARRIFEAMPQKNDVCWNTMISGLAVHGRSEDALELFHQMESRDKPNEVTLLVVLSACAHGGLVNEGLEIFSKLEEQYGLVAGIEHYGCMVDLLGRAGKLNEAYDLIKRMPVKPNDVIWGSLLGACRIHLDTKVLVKVEEDIRKLESDNASSDDARYVLLANIYAASDRWEKAESMRIMMVNRRVHKTPGCSSIMLGDIEHQFHAGAQVDSWTHHLDGGSQLTYRTESQG